jgi:glycosyltransferase involved in cell wall biosynthesis
MFPEFPYPKVSVIICTLNEEGNLPYVLPKIPAWVDEVVLVDGHSTDRTVEVAEKLRPDAKVYYQPERGKGDALRYGFIHVSGDIIITLDADGATDPEEIPKFIELLLKGYDFVKGSRFSIRLPSKKPSHRILGNLLIAAVFNILYGARYTDLCSGYNAFWKKSLERVDLYSSDCFEDEPLLIAKVKKAGLNVVEVGHNDFGRVSGESKAPSWRQGLKAIKTITREKFRR